MVLKYLKKNAQWIVLVCLGVALFCGFLLLWLLKFQYH